MSSVGVVIPCYNAEWWIARAIASVLDQAGVRAELIVVDDGSTDRSVKIVQEFGDRLICDTGPNRGGCVGATRNRGLELSRSEYLLFLDADDYLGPNSLAAWTNCAAERNADIVFGAYAHSVAARLKKGRPAEPPHEPLAVLRQWVHGWFTPTCAVLWRRAFLNSIGGWNPRLSRNEDGELAMRALLRDPRLGFSSDGLGVYVHHPAPSRVSYRGGAAVLNEQLSIFRQLWCEAQERGYKDVRESFAHAIYGIAYEGFANGHDDIGRTALAQARALGLRGHVGSFRHRALASLLGLDKKLKFTRFIRGACAARPN